MTETIAATAETQAARLEAVSEHLTAALRRPEVLERLHTAGPEQWSAVEILGHMNEMIPYWMSHARTLAAATGNPPKFGRTLDAPERLAAVQHAAVSDPDELLLVLRGEIQAAATDMRRMSAAELAKTGIHLRRGEMTVSAVIEQLIVEHAEEHAAQVRQVLGLQS